MSEKRQQYRTKHREDLIGYLKSIPGQHITAGDVCDHFRRAGRPIGTTTIYRQLDRLVDEGLLNKYTIDEASAACYEFSGQETPCPPGCFHCKCERCGRLIHMECEELSQIQEHLSRFHHFRLNPFRTVFYGICEECQGKESVGVQGGEGE